MEIFIVVASLLGFVALTLGTALFVAAEFSLTALERSTVENDVAARGDARSRAVLRAHKTLSFQLSGAQLGITITTLITGYIAEPVLDKLLRPLITGVGIPERFAGPIGLITALVVATSLSMVLGELIAKNLAIARPLPTARTTAGAMSAFSFVFAWAIRALNGAANWIVRRFGIEPADELASARSPEELGALVRAAARGGALDEDTAALVGRSLQFGDLTAEELMSPRVTVETLDRDNTVRDLLVASSRTGYSRFPVIDGDLDNILGFVHIKQAFTVPIANRDHTRLGDLAFPVQTVPASLDGDELMSRLRADGSQVAIVADEYGGTAGIVTTEDLVEEIVGDVTDEHDDERADIAPNGSGFLCSGLLRIDEMATAVGYQAPEGHYDTLGGLLMFQLGRLAQVGDVVDLPPAVSPDDQEDRYAVAWRATVTAMDGRRVDEVDLQPQAVETSPAVDDHDEVSR